MNTTDEPMDLVLLPGLLCDDKLWAAATSGTAVRVHVPELTGETTVSALAEKVLAGAPPRFALAGFSFGGCVALEMQARAPERVSHLALLSTAVLGLPEPVRQQYQRWIPRIEAGGLGAYLADVFPRYLAPGRELDEALWTLFSGMGERLGPEVAVRQMRALLEYPGFAGNLGTITCPTAVICGAEDCRVTPEAHAKLADQIPGAVLTEVKGAGHFTPLENPEAVRRALRMWLRSPSEI